MSELPLKTTRKRPNNLNLTGRDISYLLAITQSNQPYNFLISFLRKRYIKSEYQKVYQSSKNFTIAFKEIGKQICSFYCANPDIIKMLSQLDQLSGSSPKKAARLVRQLARGYTQKTYNLIKLDLKRENRQKIKEVKMVLNVYSKMRIVAARNLHLKNCMQCKEQNLKDYMQSLKKTDYAKEAEIKLKHQLLSLGNSASNIINVHNIILYRYDPELVFFPLKFLMHIPAKSYALLLKDWKQHKNKEKTLLAIEPEIFNGSFCANIIDAYKNGPMQKKSPWRVNILNELTSTVQNNMPNSAGLIAITQIEGIIWDYSSYLSEHRVWIYKKDKKGYCYAYKWISSKNAYACINHGVPKIEIDKKGKPVKLISGRDILIKTRFQEIITSYEYDFFLGEFFGVRNDYLHNGREIDKCLAIQCLALLHTLILSINNYESHRK